MIGQQPLFPHEDRESNKSGRLELMLALAFRRRLDADQAQQIIAALDISRAGDQVAANLRLTLSGLSRVPSVHQLAKRISMADALVDSGMAPTAILHTLDLRAPPKNPLVKYDPDRLRVPAGSGRESGRWASSGQPGGSAAVMSAGTAAIAFRAAPLLAPDLGAASLVALSALAESVGFAAVLGVLFVPTPNSVSSSGVCSPENGTTYDYNQDEGLLRVLDAAGEVLAAGHKDKSGVFYDANTGVPFARDVGGAIMFDNAAKAAVESSDNADATPGVVPRAETDEDEPKLCPAPGPDQPGSEWASKRAKAYQEQISRMINPQRPLDYGLAMNLVNPLSGNVVHYDDCDERTGTMIEAKGPGFNGLLGFEPASTNVRDDWLDQSLREVQAAGSRQVIWFAEQYAAERAAALFEREDNGREKIIVKVQPAV